MFLYGFVDAMSKIYDAEIDRQMAILELFRAAGIVMQPSEICIVETSVGEHGLSRLVEQKLKGLAKALYKKQRRVH